MAVRHLRSAPSFGLFTWKVWHNKRKFAGSCAMVKPQHAADARPLQSHLVLLVLMALVLVLLAVLLVLLALLVLVAFGWWWGRGQGVGPRPGELRSVQRPLGAARSGWRGRSAAWVRGR